MPRRGWATRTSRAPAQRGLVARHTKVSIRFGSPTETPEPGSVYKPGQSGCSPHLSNFTILLPCCLWYTCSSTFTTHQRLPHGYPMAGEGSASSVGTQSFCFHFSLTQLCLALKTFLILCILTTLKNSICHHYNRVERLLRGRQ